MEEKFVPYELALKLKELGFNEPCINFWYQSGTLNNSVPIYEAKDWYHSNSHLNAPLWQQAFSWFKYEHGIELSEKSYIGENDKTILSFSSEKIKEDQFKYLKVSIKEMIKILMHIRS